MVTTPLAMSKYVATGMGSASARIAAWGPKADSAQLGGNRTILISDYSPLSLSPVSSLVTFDNRDSEVSANFSLFCDPALPALFPPFTHTGFPTDSLPPLTLGSSKAFSVTYDRWWINNEKIDTGKGVDGLVWAQDFEHANLTATNFPPNTNPGSQAAADAFNVAAYSSGGTTAPGGYYIYPTDTYNNDANNTRMNPFVTNTNQFNINNTNMDGKWLVMGLRLQNPGNHNCRFLWFDCPAVAGNNWAIEYDCVMGYNCFGNARVGPFMGFNISDMTGTNNNARWYQFAIAGTENGNGAFNGIDSGPNYTTREGVFCRRFTGFTGGNNTETYNWGAGETKLAEYRRYHRNIAEGERFHVRVERMGKRVTMYINGEQVLHYSGVETNPSYKIGFQAGRTLMGIDNIKLWALKAHAFDSYDATAYKNEYIPPAASGMRRNIAWLFNATQID